MSIAQRLSQAVTELAIATKLKQTLSVPNAQRLIHSITLVALLHDRMVSGAIERNVALDGHTQHARSIEGSC